MREKHHTLEIGTKVIRYNAVHEAGLTGIIISYKQEVYIVKLSQYHVLYGDEMAWHFTKTRELTPLDEAMK